MHAFKFVVPKLDDGPGYGFLSVVVAEDEDQARQLLRDYCVKNGFKERWVEMADVTSFSMSEPAVVGWAVAK